ncbi:MAG: hypothetical protein AAGE01_23640 [Pseudomonadota bacterium]
MPTRIAIAVATLVVTTLIHASAYGQDRRGVWPPGSLVGPPQSVIIQDRTHECHHEDFRDGGPRTFAGVVCSDAQDPEVPGQEVDTRLYGNDMFDNPNDAMGGSLKYRCREMGCEAGWRAPGASEVEGSRSVITAAYTSRDSHIGRMTDVDQVLRLQVSAYIRDLPPRYATLDGMGTSTGTVDEFANLEPLLGLNVPHPAHTVNPVNKPTIAGHYDLGVGPAPGRFPDGFVPNTSCAIGSTCPSTRRSAWALPR